MGGRQSQSKIKGESQESTRADRYFHLIIVIDWYTIIIFLGEVIMRVGGAAINMHICEVGVQEFDAYRCWLRKRDCQHHWLIKGGRMWAIHQRKFLYPGW